ncbi:hypothetical protein D3C73_1280790 [compost metagenome]
MARAISHENAVDHRFIEFDQLNSVDLATIVNNVDCNYIFLAASHGTVNSLVDANYDDFLSLTVNEYLFHSNIIYSLACLSGTELGEFLVSRGVKCFWGYKDSHFFIYNELVFVECALEGLKHLLAGDSIENSFLATKNKYDVKIEELYEINPFSTSQLLANKDSLIIFESN